MMPKTETSGDNAAEEWLTSVNWEEAPVIKAEWRRREVPIWKCSQGSFIRTLYGGTGLFGTATFGTGCLKKHLKLGKRLKDLKNIW